VTAPVEIDDPVADVLAWRRANERRAYLASEQRKLAVVELHDITEALCHYCGGVATTRDHIVPRSRRTTRARDMGVPNLVPACQPCNQRKADYRSDCTCPICVEAWAVHGPTESVAVRLILTVSR